MILDLLVGNFLAKTLPNLYRAAGKLGSNLKTKLDKASRDRSERFYRGAAVALIFLSISAAFGLLLNQFAFWNLISTVITILILLPVFSQRSDWNLLKEGKKSPKNHAENTGLLMQVILNFSNKVIPFSLAFMVGGFALLLPAITISGLFYREHPLSADHPSSSYSLGIGLLREILFLVPSLIASSIIAIAMLCLPFTNLRAGLKLFNTATKGLPTTYFPLNIVATGVEICFRIQGSKSVEWIGPKDGRAKLHPEQLQQGWLCIFVANVVYLMIGMLLFFYLASLLAG